jgi:iron complex outermembrane receptor protein
MRFRFTSRPRRVQSLVCTCGLVIGVAYGAERNLADLSLAELMNEPVTSVSKKETRLGDSATAITVITADDMRRLGVTTIAEALRGVPGLDVARIDANHWAISARGLNLQYSNTLLVLVDGRSVYTPSFGGVYWDVQDLQLADVERIEVIRGPGATLWGANAVNGVVNVITKHSRDTQGTLVSASVGTEDQPGLDVRYGGTVGSDIHYRTYAKYFDRASLSDEAAFPDPWHALRAGFRADWDPSPERSAMLQGGWYRLSEPNYETYPTFTPPFTQAIEADSPSEGFDLVGRWTERYSETSQLSVQAYVDSFSMYSESRDTADLEIQHRFAPGEHHDVVWGVGYRFTSDTLRLGPALTTLPESLDSSLYTAFAQDEVTVVRNVLRVTGGVKLERNDYTGLEVQPNLRAVWTPAAGQTLWASISRAVSTPSRFYRDTRFSMGVTPTQGGPLVEVAAMPNANLPSQKLNAYEIGYRTEPVSNVSLDLATFYNRYHDIYGFAQGLPQFELSPVPHLLVPLQWAPNLEGLAYGAELAVNYKPRDSWRVTASYSWLHMRVYPDATLGEGSPAHQFGLRSYATLSPRLDFNTTLSYVSAIRSLSGVKDTVPVPAYVRLDTGLLYHLTPAIELGLWGQNLLDARHPEIASQNTAALNEIPRSVQGRITMRF